MLELRPAELSKEWKAGRFRPVYLLVGENEADKSANLEALKALFKADDFNFKEVPAGGEDGAAIVSEASTLPVFSDKRLVVVKNPKLPAAVKAALVAYLKEPLPSTTLVLFSEEKKPDLRDALTQSAGKAGAVAVFSPLREDEAEARLIAAARTAGKELAPEAARAMVAEAGVDWLVLTQELEKAMLFSPGKKIGAAEALQCLGYRKAADPWALGRLIQDRKLKEAVAQFRRFLRDGKPDEQSFWALSQVRDAVSKQLRAKRMLRAGVGKEQINKALRLHHWYDKTFFDVLERVTEGRLARDLGLIVETDAALKSKAWLDRPIEVEGLLIRLCRKSGAAAPLSAT